MCGIIQNECESEEKRALGDLSERALCVAPSKESDYNKMNSCLVVAGRHDRPYIAPRPLLFAVFYDVHDVHDVTGVLLPQPGSCAPIGHCLQRSHLGRCEMFQMVAVHYDPLHEIKRLIITPDAHVGL